MRDPRIGSASGVAPAVGLDGFAWMDEEDGVRLLRRRLNRPDRIAPLRDCIRLLRLPGAVVRIVHLETITSPAATPQALRAWAIEVAA